MSIFIDMQRRKPLTRDEFVAAARRRWPGGKAWVVDRPASKVDSSFDIDEPGRTGFTIRRLTDGTQVFDDGTPEQSLDVAAWIADATAGRDLELYGLSKDFARAVRLRPGMTTEQIESAWTEEMPF